MTSLSTREVTTVLDIGAKVLECESVDQVRRQALSLMEGGFGVEKSCFFTASDVAQDWNDESGITRGFGRTGLKRLTDFHQKYKPLDPALRAILISAQQGSNAVLTGNQVVDYAEFVRTPYYNEFCVPHDVHDILCTSLTWEKQLTGTIALLRPRNASLFSEQDMAKLKLLTPYLSAALHKADLRGQLSDRTAIVDDVVTDLPYEGLLLLDENLLPVYANQTAQSILTTMSGKKAWVEGQASSLPEPLRKYCVGFRQGLSRVPTGAAEQHFELSTAHGTKRVGVSLRMLQPGAGPHRYLVCIGTGPQKLMQSQAMRQLGLTRRQAEIAHLVSFGMTNAEIADKLYISHSTVHNHLKAIFRKAKVSSRAGLVHRISQQ